MKILGISSFYHDSASVLIIDGKVACALEEERFSRIKHDNNFPIESIKNCLKSRNLTISDIDAIAYYEKPLLKFERILETFISTYPRSFRPFIKSIPEWLNNKIKVEYHIRKEFKYSGKIFFIPHHLSHAAASYYPSPFKESAILTVDGVGENQTTCLWKANGNSIKLLRHLEFPHSLGLLYSTFTAFLGFRVNEDEYKVMGLAAYGRPIYADKIKKVMDIKDDGSIALDMKFFAFREDLKMWNNGFEKIFGKPRKNKETIIRFHKDMAASIQLVNEEIYFKMVNHLFEITKSTNMCIGGGVALNSLANGKILEKTKIQKTFIFGPAGDNGCAMGAALYVYHGIMNKKERVPVKLLDWGSSYTDEDIKEVLILEKNLTWKKYTDEELITKTARLLAKGNIIGWFQGKMEFGPRALGNRSILADPRKKSMKDRVNIIKKREKFRPFAGSILHERLAEFFHVKGNEIFPFMNHCFVANENGIKNLQAIVHEDGTTRLQTVDQSNGRYYELIREFERLTSIPCVLNTSFNIKGEPIVETPEQAIRDFQNGNMNALVIGNFIVFKSR